MNGPIPELLDCLSLRLLSVRLRKFTNWTYMWVAASGLGRLMIDQLAYVPEDRDRYLGGCIR